MRTAKQYSHAASIGLFILALAGCGWLDRPEVPESIAAGYLTIETVANAAADSEQLTTEQKRRIRQHLQYAQDNLDVATEFYAVGQESESRDHLSQAIGALALAERILRERADE